MFDGVVAGGFAQVDRLLLSEPSLVIQLTETALLAFAFGIVMPVSSRFCAKSLKSRPWYDRAAGIIRDIYEKTASIQMTDEMLDKAMGQMIPIMCQHALGGLLCMPAIFGLGVPHVAALALARHGALIELGWELQDTVERLYERFFQEKGHITQPNGLFFFMAMHHAMQWAMVIPMNLYYSHLSGYHELVFMLEGAAGCASLIAFYSYTLDTSKRSDLRQMVFCNALNLAVMVYTRFVHYWWSSFKCLQHFYVEGSYVVLTVALVCSVFMMPFVALNFIPQQWKKLVKFSRMYFNDNAESDDKHGLPILLNSQQTQADIKKEVGKMHDD